MSFIRSRYIPGIVGMNLDGELRCSVICLDIQRNLLGEKFAEFHTDFSLLLRMLECFVIHLSMCLNKICVISLWVYLHSSNFLYS
jgi:hypothetical protein